MEEKLEVAIHFHPVALREKIIQTSFLAEQFHRIVLIGECMLMTLLFGKIMP